MVNYACCFNESEMGKYFEWIIKIIILYHAIENSVWPTQAHICMAHNGKVGCNTVKHTMALLVSDWLHFLRHGISEIIYDFLILTVDACLSFRMFWQFLVCYTHKTHSGHKQNIWIWIISDLQGLLSRLNGSGPKRDI